MIFNTGDTVMHWNYGIGKIVNLEERDVAGSKALYYAVQVHDMTVWVPADSKLESRLRFPTPKNRFKKLLAILSCPSEKLPEDRLERRTRLLKLLNDGSPESLCQIIRDLSTYQKQKTGPLNDNDHLVLRQSRSTLLGEWGFVLSITHARAEFELHRLLTSEPLSIVE
jgi:CarD family transcriptional regulator